MLKLSVCVLLLASLAHGQNAALPPGATVLPNLTYARPPQRELKLDLYLPAAKGPRPVVLYVHGGGWSSGSKDNPPTTRFLRYGWAVASISYRLSHEARFPAQIHDVKAAVRWLRAHAREHNLDPERIAAWGGSAGGHLVALLGTSGGVKELEGDLGHAEQSSRVVAVVNFFGPTDFFQLNRARKVPRPDDDKSPEARLVGGLLADKQDLVRLANPITHITPDDPPFLVMHGDQDDLVPPHQSELFVAALRAKARPVQYHLVPGQGHGFRTDPAIDLLVDEFLAQHLGRPANGPVSATPLPRLRVHEQGRFLVDEAGKPVFLLADTAWGMVRELRREQIDDYLRHRRVQGFNAVTFVLFSPGAKGNAYGAQAFVTRDGQLRPDEPLVTPRSDPDEMGSYDHWDHVDYAIRRARELGLYALVLPTWGSGVAGAYNGTPTPEQVFTAETAYKYGRWLGARYGREPHLIWMLGGDRSAQYPQLNKDYRPVFRAMGEGIGDGTHGENRQDGKADYRGLLLSYHPAKKNPQSADWFHNDAWLSFNSIQHWPEDQVPAITADWTRSPVKPTWVFEGRYEAYFKNNYQPEQWGEWPSRFQAWQTTLAGAFGHTYGHERVFGFATQDDTGDLRTGWNWRAELDAPGARTVVHLATFMATLTPPQALTRVPDQELLDGPAGTAERLRSDRLTAMRTSDNAWAAVYTAAGRPVRLRLDRLAAGPLAAHWFNPRTGHWHVDGKETRQRQAFRNGLQGGAGATVQEFDPPGEPADGNDWVLVVSR